MYVDDRAQIIIYYLSCEMEKKEKKHKKYNKFYKACSYFLYHIFTIIINTYNVPTCIYINVIYIIYT